MYIKRTNGEVKKMQKSKRRKRKVLQFRAILIILFILSAMVLICSHFFKEIDKRIEYTGNNGENQPVLIDKSNPINQNIYQKLSELSKENSSYKKILENKEAYPIDLLKGLIQNSEMLDFVKGYLNADKESISSLTSQDLNSENPLFIQWDKRWGYTNYGDSLMAITGCGPTSLSMAIVALTGNKEATPYNVAKFSYKNGYYANGKGSLWTLISEGSSHYGLNAKTLPSHKGSLIKALDDGKVLILAMGPGKFTTSGHFIVIYDYDENGFYVNDPNSYERSEKIWPFSEFKNEIKNIWSLSVE